MNDLKVVAQVMETTDYSIFKPTVGNRNVNKLHVKRLKDSFKDTYLMAPAIVNQNFEMIDGNHRKEAAQSMGLPFRFIICNDYGLREIQILNENMKNWSKLDYLNAYCELMKPEYLRFRKFMNMFPDFGLQVCETILTDKASGNHTSATLVELKGVINVSGSYAIRYFQEGDLVIPNYEKSIENAEKILMIKPYYDGYNRPVFVRAMIGVFKVNEYNHARFLNRLKANQTLLQHCSNVSQYKLLIEDIYNFRSRDKVTLRF